jgi:hypothetical protein
MKMRKTYITLSVLVLFLVTACGLSGGLGFRTVRGSGKVISERRDVSGFVRVDVCCGMELTLTQGGSESLEIEADDNFMPEIVTRVVNGRLAIEYQDTTNVSYRPSQPVKLYLSAVDLQEADISGGGKLDSESFSSDRFELRLSGGSEAVLGELVTDRFEVKISGGGEIDTESIKAQSVKIDLSGGSDAVIKDLEGESFTLDMSGGGKASIAGIVSKSRIDLSGGSIFDGQDLSSRDTVFSCSGGGGSTIWVSDTLDVDLSGGCTLRYYGQPEIVEQNLSGGSDLRSLGER